MTGSAASMPLWWWTPWPASRRGCRIFLDRRRLALAAGESVVAPRSHCTGCERALSARARAVGRCVEARALPRMRARVHWRYPAIEGPPRCLRPGDPVFGPTLTGLAAALLGMVLVPVVVIDLDTS